MTMAAPAENLSADDLIVLAKQLSRGEQLRLARRLLEPEPETGDDLLAKRRAGIGRYAGRGWIAEDFDGPSENAIANPEALLAWGSVDDPTFERPPQAPLVERDR
jgi:hypothetical protein